MSDQQMQEKNEAQIQTAPAETQGNRRFAGFWIRALAMLIDAVILGIVGGIITKIFGSLGGILNLAISIAYFVYFIGTSGQTPGKMVCSIKVINADGTNLDFQKAFLRWLGYLISSVILFIGYIIAAFDEPEKRALHDRIFETRVIYTN